MNGETEDETRQERNTQQEQGQGQPKSPLDGRQSAWKFLYQTDPKLSEPSYGRVKDRRKREKERREKEEKKGGGKGGGKKKKGKNRSIKNPASSERKREGEREGAKRQQEDLIDLI